MRFFKKKAIIVVSLSNFQKPKTFCIKKNIIFFMEKKENKMTSSKNEIKNTFKKIDG